MKAFKILAVVAVLFASDFSNAQIARVAKEQMAATRKATYYYLPEVQSYYDIRNRKYIYANNGKWVTATSLPAKYRSYDFKRSRKVVLTDKSAPYRNFKTHKTKYYKSTKHVVRPGNSGNAPGHNKLKHRGKGHGHNDSKHGGKHND